MVNAPFSSVVAFIPLDRVTSAPARTFPLASLIMPVIVPAFSKVVNVHSSLMALPARSSPVTLTVYVVP